MRILLTLLLMITGGLAAAADTRDADIDKVFDRHKGKVYATYRRAMGDNPRNGKFVFEIDVAQSGDVTACRVRFSDLDDARLERDLCDQLSRIQFNPRAARITAIKTLEFFFAK